MTTRSASSGPLPAWLCWPLPTTRQIVTLAVLFVTFPITGGLFNEQGVPVALGTVLVAAGFLRFGFRVKRARLLPVYCLGAGAIWGWINTPLSMVLFALWERDSNPAQVLMFGLVAGLLGFIGAFVGLPYGMAYYLPLRAERRARDMPSDDARERVLITSGAWALTALGLALCLLPPGSSRKPSLLERISRLPHQDLIALSWQVAIVVAVLMLAVGTSRLLVRQLWLRRVRHNKVPGWHLCAASDFPQPVVESLPTFNRPWWFKGEPSVLAKNAVGSSYRTHALWPAYLVT